MLACWGFVQRPLDPEQGDKYIRYADEYEDLKPIVIEPAGRVGDHVLERAILHVETVKIREDFEPPD